MEKYINYIVAFDIRIEFPKQGSGSLRPWFTHPTILQEEVYTKVCFFHNIVIDNYELPNAYRVAYVNRVHPSQPNGRWGVTTRQHQILENFTASSRGSHEGNMGALKVILAIRAPET